MTNKRKRATHKKDRKVAEETLPRIGRVYIAIGGEYNNHQRLELVPASLKIDGVGVTGYVSEKEALDAIEKALHEGTEGLVDEDGDPLQSQDFMLVTVLRKVTVTSLPRYTFENRKAVSQVPAPEEDE